MRRDTDCRKLPATCRDRNRQSVAPAAGLELSLSVTLVALDLRPTGPSSLHPVRILHPVSLSMTTKVSPLFEWSMEWNGRGCSVWVSVRGVRGSEEHKVLTGC